ncbi:MAG TPA: hypothetical protein DF699_03025, partial [Phycisphaerales bacterium]|nr:hypothetical protein [Phycisphaerales bacterium]
MSSPVQSLGGTPMSSSRASWSNRSTSPPARSCCAKSLSDRSLGSGSRSRSLCMPESYTRAPRRPTIHLSSTARNHPERTRNMGLLEGKVGLVVGVANDRSYAWHIANALHEHGATVAYSHLPGEKNARRTGKAVEKITANPWLHPCDAGNDESLDELFNAYAKDHDRLDFLVHSIAFADREWLQPGMFSKTPRKAYLDAIDISAYSLSAMSGRAQDLMAKNGGGSI